MTTRKRVYHEKTIKQIRSYISEDPTNRDLHYNTCIKKPFFFYFFMQYCINRSIYTMYVHLNFEN